MEPATVRLHPTEPINGDLVLHCGHLLSIQKHTFYAPDGIKYKRPDKSQHVASWVVCCPDCMRAADGDPSKLRLKGDGIWEKP